MAEYLIQDTTLTAIADAIRTRSGTNTNLTMTPEEMAKHILSSGGNYTNMVPKSTTNGTTLYNSPYGYTDGKYVSGNSAGYGDKTGYVATGNIYLPTGTNAIYIKGATWDTADSYCRFIAGAAAPASSYFIYADGTGANGALSRFFTVTTLGTNYYKWTLTDFGKEHFCGKYYKMSFKGSGANLIITHDELIW